MKRLGILLMLLAFNVIAKPVNINTADAKTIAASLQGIGQKKAEAIVKYRKTHGKFKSIKELAKVKGIGLKTLQKNKGDILIKGKAKASKKKSKAKKK